jgi:WD40-like Beta Propeller Repeat
MSKPAETNILMRSLILSASVVWILAACAAARAADSAQADLGAAAERGRAILERLGKEPAAWLAVCRLESGATVRVTMTVDGDRRRKVVEMQVGERWTPVVQIIERDGLWYASNGPFARKCRPYELTTEGPIVYMLLERANPEFLTDPRQAADATLEQVNNGIAILRHPLDPATKAQIANILAQFEDLTQKAGKPLPSEAVKTVRHLQDLQEHGLPTHVDLATGLFVEHGNSKLWTQITEFRFLPEAPKDAFDVDDRQWDDYSDDPTAAGVDNLAMLGYRAGFKAGQKSDDVELQLMDVRSGRFRRVPFPGLAAMPGCFLPDRKSVVVHGLMSGTGGLMPYRVDLQSGQTMALAAETFQNANTMGATLSPDGRTLAIMRAGVGGAFLKNQVYLIDLASDKATPLGESLDAYFLSWLPDGERLLLRVNEYEDLNSKTSKWLATIDLDGKLTKLFPGDFPILAGSPLQIVFEDPDTRLWSSCDLDGKNAKLYAGGLKGHGFPAPSPDGKQLLMMYFQKGKTPVPMLLDFGKSSGRVLTKAPGLWAMPKWK